MRKKIKLFDPLINQEEENAILKVLKSGFWASGAGTENVLKFENEFRKYIGSNDCISVNSGTAALHLALSLVDLRNKEVILPSLSFVSTAHSILYNGGKPIFVDVDPKTLCLDTDKAKKAITEKTRIILPVHFGGTVSHINEILELCQENNLILIEDAAHAAGASYGNKKIGSHGMAVCFSFHPVKNLAMPSGGLISINHHDHKKFRNSLLARRWCGITNRKDAKYDVQEIGWNYYMNEISAAIGLVQLKKLDKTNNHRRIIAKKYYQKINLEQKMPFDKNASYHFYWIMVKDRKNFRKKMSSLGIETGIHYTPIHTFGFYKSTKKLPITEYAGQHIVTIPTHPNLTDTDVNTIIDSVNKLA